MFTYYYRILDRFNQPVTAIAIFTGRNKTNIQDKFEDYCLGTSILYKYNIIGIRDYPDELLINNENPFALVMLVAKSVLLSGGDLENKLLKQKLLILRILHARGLLKDPKINAIFVFLNNYILFEKNETNLIFMEQTDLITGKINTVGIIEQLAEMKEQEGLKKGLQQGEEKANRLFVINLLKEGTFSLQKIASLANVSLTFVKKVKASLQTGIGGVA